MIKAKSFGLNKNNTYERKEKDIYEFNRINNRVFNNNNKQTNKLVVFKEWFFSVQI